MRKTGLTKGTKITIGVSAAVVVILASLGVAYYKTGGKVFQKKTVIKELPESPASEDLLATYVNETKYIGGIGYPTVYNLPFQKSDTYISNKELWDEDEINIEECVATAKKFSDTLFNSSYRTINENRDLFTANLADLMDRDFYYERTEDNEGMDVYECIENAENYITDNEIEMESTFKTDTSLVYSDGYYLMSNIIYVRGILEYEVYSSKDDRLPVSNEKTPIMVEFIMHENINNPDKYDVLGFEFTFLNGVEANGTDQ